MAVSKHLAGGVGLLLLSHGASGATTADAQALLTRTDALTVKYQFVEISPPEPLDGARGEYLSAYRLDGSLTEWAQKMLEAKPDGFSFGDCKKKSQKLTISGFSLGGGGKGSSCITKVAVKSAGGKRAVAKTTELSFERLDNLAIYLHAMHRNDETYEQALALTLTLYPELEDRYHRTILKAKIAALRAATLKGRH